MRALVFGKPFSLENSLRESIFRKDLFLYNCPQYKARQLHVVDGEEIKYDPVSFMNRLQRQLNIQPFVDYAKKIRNGNQEEIFHLTI